jgi:hypothetical protein
MSGARSVFSKIIFGFVGQPSSVMGPSSRSRGEGQSSSSAKAVSTDGSPESTISHDSGLTLLAMGNLRRVATASTSSSGS